MWLLEVRKANSGLRQIQELKEAKIHYQEKLQKQRAYYEKKIEDLNFMLGEKQKQKQQQKDDECQNLRHKQKS